MSDVPVAARWSSRVGEFLNRLDVFVILLCVLGQVADVWSSVVAISHVQDGIYETNPFARNPDYTFNLAHGVFLKLFWICAYCLVSRIIYEVCKRDQPKWAPILASVPLLYMAFIGFDAAIHNCLIMSPLYVPNPQILVGR